MNLPRPLRRAPAAFALLAVAALATAALPPARAAAQDGGCIDQLTDAEVQARYQMIYGAFEHQQTYARLWYFGWISVFTGLATANSVMAGLNVQDRRPGYVASVIGSALSLLSFTVFPRTGLEGAMGAKRLRAQPASTPAERRARLRYAEDLLEDSAFRQKQGVSFMTHAQGYIWGLGNGLFFGLSHKYKDVQTSLLLAFGSPVIAELRAFTTPTTSVEAWENYRSAAKSCMAPAFHGYPAPEPREPSFTLSGGPGQIAFTVRWF